MANKEAKKRDRTVLIISSVLTVVFIILSIVSSTKWLFIVGAVISGLVSLVMLLGMAHLKSTVKPQKYHYVKDRPQTQNSAPSTYTPQPGYNEEGVSLKKLQIESELKQIPFEHRKYWDAYYKAQQKGYRYFQRAKTPLQWEKDVWAKLTTYQQIHYLDVVKHDIKQGKYIDWQENHQGLVKAKRAWDYIVNAEYLDPLYNKLNDMYSGSNSIEQKDSAEQAARDIRRILNSSGNYSDGSNGTCHYVIREIYANKYDKIVINVEVTSSRTVSASSYDPLSLLESNLKSEIYDAAYVESGGFGLDITVY